MMMSSPPQICHRCELRATNNRIPEAYQTVNESEKPCSACLGILQQPSLTTALSKISACLPLITHKSCYKINATIPSTASLIRHRALGLFQKPHTNPVTLREAVKWTLSHMLRRLGLTYSQDADLFVDLVYTHPETASDTNLIIDPLQNPLHSRKRPRDTSNSTANVSRILDSLSDHDFRRVVPVPPSQVSTHVQVTATLSTAPLLLAGTYVKTSRVVSQTPWFVDRPQSLTTSHTNNPSCMRTKRTQSSIEDVVSAGIKPVLKPDKITFTAGGREDVDVRMLGSGRPFVLEVLNPCIVPSLVTSEHVARMAAISAESSTSVALKDLRVVPKSYFAKMREYESEKRKHYRCVVWVAKPQTFDSLTSALEIDGGFQLFQRTPLRVLHRRTQAVRERHVYEVRVVRLVNENAFVLDLVAQAGTYIKEFVHGDNGRTVPNVAQILGCDADILQLDVTRIRLGGE